MEYFTLIYATFVSFLFFYGQVLGSLKWLNLRKNIHRVNSSNKLAVICFYIAGGYGTVIAILQFLLWVGMPQPLIEWHVPLIINDSSWACIAVLWSSSLFWGLTRNLNFVVMTRLEKMLQLVIEDVSYRPTR